MHRAFRDCLVSRESECRSTALRKWAEPGFVGAWGLYSVGGLFMGTEPEIIHTDLVVELFDV